jgi:hypothetical protein
VSAVVDGCQGVFDADERITGHPDHDLDRWMFDHADRRFEYAGSAGPGGLV